MNLKIILFLILLTVFSFDMYTLVLIWQQRKKPLPKRVEHIYSKERYQEFIAYKKDGRKIYILNRLFTLAFDTFVIFSPFFTYFDDPNPYVSFFKTFIAITLISNTLSLPLDYYSTFYIREKYGLNKQSKKDFFKDFFIGLILNSIIMVLLASFIIFVGEHLSVWTNNFNITYAQSTLLVAVITLALFGVGIIISLISLLSLRLQYHFTELEDGPLRSKIEAFLKESKKKVAHIKVYDESKKSTSKNAFLLRLLGYREFGIADNFLDENSEDELLAVLLHEIGHLKHKKDILDYTKYLIIALELIVLIFLLANANIAIAIIEYIQSSFNLNYINYYLIMAVISNFKRPLSTLYDIFDNYRSCTQEKEADFNAVNHGYGQALIDTFTKLSSDELIDINPHPLIVLLKHDHPSMVQRITYIDEQMEHLSKQISEQ